MKHGGNHPQTLLKRNMLQEQHPPLWCFQDCFFLTYLYMNSIMPVIVNKLQMLLLHLAM